MSGKPAKQFCNAESCKVFTEATQALGELQRCQTPTELIAWVRKYNNLLYFITTRSMPAVCSKDKRYLFKGEKGDSHFSAMHLPMQTSIAMTIATIAVNFLTANIRNQQIVEHAPVAIQKRPPQQVSPDAIASTNEEMCGNVEYVTVDGVSRPVKCALRKIDGCERCAIHERILAEQLLRRFEGEAMKIVSPKQSPAPSPVPVPVPFAKQKVVQSAPSVKPIKPVLLKEKKDKKKRNPAKAAQPKPIAFIPASADFPQLAAAKPAQTPMLANSLTNIGSTFATVAVAPPVVDDDLNFNRTGFSKSFADMVEEEE